MLKPRVPGYHGNQIKRRISSESRNLNYSDSFMKGKMKIPLTIQRRLHCKGRKKKAGGGWEKLGKCHCSFHLTTQFKGRFPVLLRFTGCLITTFCVNSEKMCTKDWCNPQSLFAYRDKPIAVEREHKMRNSKSPTKPGARMMKSRNCTLGIKCSCILCGKRFYLSEQDGGLRKTPSRPHKAYISKEGLRFIFRLCGAQSCLRSAEY